MNPFMAAVTLSHVSVFGVRLATVTVHWNGCCLDYFIGDSPLLDKWKWCRFGIQKAVFEMLSHHLLIEMA
jgi:hypothetical protein